MDRKQIQTYFDEEDGTKLFPLQKGGKAPHSSMMDWPNRVVPVEETERLIAKGHNVGYRIPEGEMVIDMDPRNYEKDGKTKEEVEAHVAGVLGHFEFSDVLEEFPTVVTGSGGYHIYLTMSDEWTGDGWSKGIEGWKKSIEFKKKGSYVVTAGSLHPNGERYRWVNGLRLADREEVEEAVVSGLADLLTKGRSVGSSGAEVGDGDETWRIGVLSPKQLKIWVLDRLDVEDFAHQAGFFSFMGACHHVTNGEGEEEFVAWCQGDEEYADQGHEDGVRNDWNTRLQFNKKGGQVTDVRSLMRMLTGKYGSQQDTPFSNHLDRIKEEHAFANDFAGLDEDDEDEVEEDDPLLKKARAVAGKDVVDEIKTPPGAAMDKANKISPTASKEEKYAAVKLTLGAEPEEAIVAEETLVARKILNQKEFNKRKKDLTKRGKENLSELLSNRTIRKVFNKGRHILVEPDGQAWIYHQGDLVVEGSCWIPVNDEYLGRIVYSMLDALKENKIPIDREEVSIVTMAVKSIRIRQAQLKPLIHDVTRALSMLNCRNGEVWILPDGSYERRDPRYDSYSTYCLNVTYDEWAVCALHDQTEREIWRDFPDTEDLLRHGAETDGYMIQPNKPDPNWYVYHGPGGDGKSLTIDIMDGMIGKGLLKTDVNILKIGSGNRDQFSDSALVGKLVVAIEEVPHDHVLNDAGLKLLAGNNKISTRNAYGKAYYDFKYIGTLVMCTNHYPRIQSVDGGIMRRANVRPFNRSFTKHGEADLNRAQDILGSEEEKSGILNKWLAGYRRYKERGHFVEPESCRLAKQELLGATSNVVRFVRDCVVRGEQTELLGTAKDLYDLYGRWCAKNGQSDAVVSKQDCNLVLVDLGFTIKRRGGNKLKVYGGSLSKEVSGLEFDAVDGFEQDEDE